MPTINFTTKFAKNGETVLTPAKLLELYFHGISICTKDGRRITDDTLNQKIKAAQEFVEKTLSIKLKKQLVTETRQFVRTEYESWGHLQMTYPVREVLEMNGFISTTLQTKYPLEWVSEFKSSDESLFQRIISIVPAGHSATMNSVVYVGITPNAGFFGAASVPNYWNVVYCTGFNKVPQDILDVVGKVAAMQIFAITGDIVLGSGIASQSLSFDGLSQSINTTQSAENSAHSARIRQYQNELKKEIPRLINYYKGITFNCF